MNATARQEQGSWDTITAALEHAVGEGRPAGEWTRYRCPAHEGDGHHHNPSLGLKYDAQQHKTVVKCFAGCDNELILDKLGLRIRDVYDHKLTRDAYRDGRTPRRARPRTVSRADRAIDAAGLPLIKPPKELGRQTGPAREVARYPYVDADGHVEGEVVRKHTPHEHGRDKEFYQRHWSPQAGRMEAGGFAPLPFELPKVLDAVRDGRTVYVVEGEEDVLAAERIGITATCNAAGSGKWKPEHAQWLRGARRVVIVADRDAPGYRHAALVAESLSGLVGQVRIVQAADGKDLRDHLNAGHELGELEPVPYLDPLHLTPEPGSAALAADPVVGEVTAAAAPAAAVSPNPPTHPEPELDGGTPMGWISGLDQNTAPVHSDEVDHVGAKFSQLVAQLMNQMMLLAQKAIAQQRLDAERARNQDEAAERAHKAAVAAERKAVEGRVTKLAERGWELATRADIVEAVRDATTHAANSPILQRALAGLIEHVHGRYGVHLDVQNGYVTVDAPGMSGQLAVAEQGRTAAARVRTAQDRMVSEVAAEAIPESVKEQLYKDISDWQRNPSGHSLHNLTKKLETAGVTAKARTKVRFIAVYLGTPGVELPPYELGAAVAASPTAELRKLGEPLVDPAEEAKFRVDTLLTDYQSRLRSGLDTDGVQERLREEVKVLTPEDQALARTQGTRIRANPAAQVKPLFPGYVDRVQLAEAVRSYAVLAPQIEIRQLVDHETDADWFGQQRKRAHGLRQQIDQAIKSGKGLHPLEVDQLKAVLTDIEAGKIETPALLFVDDRSAAAVDTERSDQIARQAATAHRHKLEEILEHGAGVPNGVVRRAHNEIANLADANTGLAGGRMTLGDFEFRAADSKMLTKLEALGVPEPTRNQVRKEMVRAVEDSATTGKQARRIADRWTERRDLVVAGRAAKPAFDGPQRRADLANDLRAAGLDEDSIAQRLAASTGRARPIGAAVNEGPGSNGRTTTPGAGVQRTHHRGKGRGNGHDKGLGL